MVVSSSQLIYAAIVREGAIGWACTPGSQREGLPELPITDREVVEGTDVVPGEVAADGVSDASGDNAYNELTGDAPAEESAGPDGTDSKGGDTTPPADTAPDTTAAKFQRTCVITTSNVYGMTFSAVLRSTEFTNTSSSNWSNLMLPTDPAINGKDQCDWPTNEYQVLPDGTSNVVDSYDLKTKITDGSGTATIQNLYSSASASNLPTVIPTAFTKDGTMPQDIKPDGSNVNYLASDKAISVKVSCMDDNCSAFVGDVSSWDAGWPFDVNTYQPNNEPLNSIELYCSTTEVGGSL